MDSLPANSTSFRPISSVWPTYVAGLITIDALSAIVPDQASAIGWFLKAIPYNFYAWFAVLLTLLFALDKLPFLGKPMRAAIGRYNRCTGSTGRDPYGFQ